MSLIREMIPDGVVEPPERDSIVKPYLMSHGTLECYDLNETRKFYAEFLGLESVRHAPIGMAVRLGLKFHVICLEVADTLKPVGLGNHWGVDVESREKVDEAYQSALRYKSKYKIREIGHPTLQHGAYSFYMEDLDHNWWEIQYIPHFLHDDLFEFGDVFGSNGQPIDR
jgi:catechol 2,3-dioxygenase-like lactoylglutathione lyase family enzyme